MKTFRYREGSSKKIVFLIIVAVLLISFATTNGMILASLFLVVFFLPTFRQEGRSRIGPSVDPFLFIGFSYVLNFPIAYLFQNRRSDQFSLQIADDTLLTALVWTLRGFCCMSLGYIMARQLRPVRNSNKGRGGMGGQARGISQSMVIGLGLVGPTGVLASFLIAGRVPLVFVDRGLEAGGSGTIVMVSLLMAQMSFLFIFLSVAREERLLKLTPVSVLISVNVLIQVFVMFASGTKAHAFLLFLCFAVPKTANLDWRELRRMIVYSCIFLILTYGTFSIIGNYRKLVRHSAMVSESGLVDSIRRSFDLTIEAMGMSFSEFLAPDIRREKDFWLKESGGIAGRLTGGIFEFGSVLRISNKSSPYSNAVESTLVPICAIVPRSIWKSKPVFFGSGEHAAKYYGWRFGGISVSLPGSFYWTWGFLGVCLGMCCVGALLGYLVDCSQRQGRAQIVYLCGAFFLLSRLVYVGFPFQSIIIDLTRVMIFVWIISKVSKAFIRVKEQERAISSRMISSRHRRGADIGLPVQNYEEI